MYNWLTKTQKSLSRPEFCLGLPLKTEILTLEIVTRKLLLLITEETYNFPKGCGFDDVYVVWKNSATAIELYAW